MLFKMLSRDPDIQVTGLIYSRHSRSLNEKLYRGKSLSQRLLAQARLLSSMVTTPAATDELELFFRKIKEYLGLVTPTGTFQLQALNKDKLFNVIWRQFLSHSYEARDYALFEQNDYVLSDLNAAGYIWRLHNRYPEPLLDTRGYDVVIFPDVTPVKVSPGTKKIVRYHDMIPLKLPDTLENHHHITYHHRALVSCLKNSFFACVSQATLNDLESVYGKQKDRTAVIPCTVSPSYYREEAAGTLDEIILNRSCRPGQSGKGFPENKAERQTARRPYFLAVSTIEPRKNYSKLIEAFEKILSRHDVTLILVGSEGWKSESLFSAMERLEKKGRLILLRNVTPDEMRVVYSGALALVSTSFSEGFGYSGVEAMRCGTPVIASNIPCYREVYGDAAIYCDPYDTASIADALSLILEHESGELSQSKIGLWQQRGLKLSESYTMESTMPEWKAFARPSRHVR